MFSRLGRIFRVSPVDWLLFFSAWFCLIAFDVGLRLLPFRVLLNWASKPQHNSKTNTTNAIIQRTHLAVRRAQRRHMIPMTCLRRSLTMQFLLGRQGISTQLRIGVAKEGEKLLAHAWLEYNGAIILEPEVLTDQFTTINIL